MDTITQKLEEVNQLLAADTSQPYSLGFYDPQKLKLLETNARFMANETFAALVNNIKRDKGLSSVPLIYAAENPEAPTVLSGNHRVMAAREAKVPRILCLVILEKKTLDEQVAIQLSHNAIAGADDLVTLKKLYEQINALDMKAYSGLDEATIQQLASIKFEPISEPRLLFKTVTLLFLPNEVVELRGMLDHVDAVLKDEDAYALQVRDYAEFFTLLTDAKADLKIRNSATALLELMRAGSRKIREEHPAPAEVAA